MLDDVGCALRVIPFKLELLFLQADSLLPCYTRRTRLARRDLRSPDIAELRKPSAVIQSAAGMRPMLGGIFSLREGAEPMETSRPHRTCSIYSG